MGLLKWKASPYTYFFETLAVSPFLKRKCYGTLMPKRKKMVKVPKIKRSKFQEYFSHFYFLFYKCAWCGKDLSFEKNNSRIARIALDTKLIKAYRPPFIKEALKRFKGCFFPVPMKSIKRISWCFVADKNWPFQEWGGNVIFFCCSQTCGAELYDALMKDLPGQMLLASTALQKINKLKRV